MTIQDRIQLRPRPMTALLAGILTAHGCAADEAAYVAQHLVEASRSGHDSHGIVRIRRYHDWLQSGQLVARAPFSKVADLGALMQFDGGEGLGQWAAHRAAAAGVQRAQDQGAAIVLLRRAGHIGRVGAFAEQAAEQGIISLFFTNVAGSRLVAPFGAAERAASTAPVTVGVPQADGRHFILDFATSLVAEGKALVAAKSGGTLPGDALVDADGALTGDPAVLYGETLTAPTPNPRAGDGALRSFGGHKGSGLMLACELLGGALTGNGTNGPAGHRFGNGMFAVFIDPAQCDNPGGIAGEIAEYLAFVNALTPAQGHDTVRIPGDSEREMRAARADSVPIAAAVWTDILAIAADLGLAADLHSLLAAEPARV